MKHEDMVRIVERESVYGGEPEYEVATKEPVYVSIPHFRVVTSNTVKRMLYYTVHGRDYGHVVDAYQIDGDEYVPETIL